MQLVNDLMLSSYISKSWYLRYNSMCDACRPQFEIQLYEPTTWLDIQVNPLLTIFLLTHQEHNLRMQHN